MIVIDLTGRVYNQVIQNEIYLKNVLRNRLLQCIQDMLKGLTHISEDVLLKLFLVYYIFAMKMCCRSLQQTLYLANSAQPGPKTNILPH